MPLLPQKIENKLSAPMVCYCKDCRKIVDGIPVGRKFAYKCPICQTRNVAFGTLKSIKNFYRVEEDGDAEKNIQEEKKRLQQEM